MGEIVFTGKEFFYASEILREIDKKYTIGYTKSFGDKKLIIECAKENILDIENMVAIRQFNYEINTLLELE